MMMTAAALRNTSYATRVIGGKTDYIWRIYAMHDKMKFQTPDLATNAMEARRSLCDNA